MTDTKEATMTTLREYREVPMGYSACVECDEIIEHLAERRLNTQPSVRVHGPRNARCPGSRRQGKQWIDATHLPLWNELSDVDKGCALMFVWKVHWERSYRYALDNYPATYRDHPLLLDLPADDRCRHANAVAYGDWDRQRHPRTGAFTVVSNRIGDDEFQRLYNLALQASP